MQQQVHYYFIIYCQSFSLKVNVLLKIKLLNAAVAIAKIKANGCTIPCDSTNQNIIVTCTNAPNELNRLNFAYCESVFFREKSQSSNVQTLFKIKLVIINAIIPKIFA